MFKFNHLAVLSKLAPKKDVRYYLNSVHIDVTQEHINYVVTNGHYMAIIQEQNLSGLEVGNYTIPVETAVQIKSDFSIVSENDGFVIKCNNGASFAIKEKISNFPQWRRVVPNQETLKQHANTLFECNPEYTHVLHKANNDFCKRNKLPNNSTQYGIFSDGEQWDNRVTQIEAKTCKMMTVLMPMRVSTIETIFKF